MKDLALQICAIIKEAGGTPWFVGGYVRDFVMGITSRDLDIEVFGLTAEQLEPVLEKFGEVNFVGKQYGAYKIKGIDITLPREDSQTGDSHKDVEVSINPIMSLTAAAKRRDLTINALYMNPFTEAIHDPLHGLLDISLNKMLKASSLLTFAEDALRPLRAARFKALFPQLNLAVTLLDVIKDMDKARLKTLPIDRVFGELRKVLMEAPVPSVLFHSLDAMGITEVVFPELHALKKVEQGRKHHPEGNVYIHTMMALDVTPVEERSLDVMLAILFHDLGKLSVPAEDVGGGHTKFCGHAEDLTMAEIALSRITLDKSLTESVLSLILHHMRPYDMNKGVTKKQVRKLAAKVDIPKLMKVHIADRLGRGINILEARVDNMKLPTAIMEAYREIEGEVAPLITGQDLIDCGLKPGKHFGEILKDLYALQLEEVFEGKEGAAEFLPRYLIEKGIV